MLLGRLNFRKLRPRHIRWLRISSSLGSNYFKYVHRTDSKPWRKNIYVYILGNSIDRCRSSTGYVIPDSSSIRDVRGSRCVTTRYEPIFIYSALGSRAFSDTANALHRGNTCSSLRQVRLSRVIFFSLFASASKFLHKMLILSSYKFSFIINRLK